ncbi:MAG: type IV pilin [Candidatus Thalassarchaeaceae archaeon]|nr:type IV pilin [Candidatus Thalassarchaeaceae archaeon]
MVTKGKNKAMGGTWLLLTLLMIGMSWGQTVPPATDAISATAADDAEASVDDPFALSVEDLETVDYTEIGYPDENELVGSRTATSKTYVTDEGMVAIVATDPIHYLDDGGVWQEIDLNIETTSMGWAVTENSFTTEFSMDVNRGVTLQVDGNIDPILTGINPTVVMMERDLNAPMMYGLDPTADFAQTGGNVLRYPLGEGIALDYQVTSTQVKQNLVVRDMPFFTEGFDGWFGLQEEMLLPHGYSIFNGESPLRDGEVFKTNDSFTIRNIETGDLLATVPAPLVIDSNIEGEPAIGQYLIMQIGEHVQLTTAIDAAWLTDENRTYPIMIDPTLDVLSATTWYAYRYAVNYGWTSFSYERAYSTNYNAATCQGANSYTTACLSSSSYSYYNRYAVHRFNLANIMPSGATVSSVDYENHVSRYRSGSRSFEVAVMKSGSSQSSTMIDPSSYTYSYGMYIARYAKNSADSSATTTLSDPGIYYSGSRGAVRSISMNSNGVSDVQDAVDGNGAGTSGNILGLAVRNTANAPYWYWCTQNTYTYYGCNNNANKPHLEITYTGGSDTTAPLAEHAAFDGKTTYLAGARTMYLELTDASGIDTTSAGAPHLWYRVDGGSWTGVTSSTIGTCAASAACFFKATIPAQTAPATGTTDVDYFWAFRDTPAPPNGGVSGTTGTLPAGGTGMPNNINAAAISPYGYSIEAIDNAADGDNKWQVKASGWNSYSFYSAVRYYDWQMTYYEPSREYHMEYDTSNCGTGSLSCFSTNAVLDLRYYPGTTRLVTSAYAQANLEKVNLPGISMHAKNGVGHDVIWYHDGSSWGVMGYDVANGNGIEQPNSGGDIYNTFDYGTTDDGYVKVAIPGDITGYFGSFSWNASYSLNSNNRNLFCINTNNHPIMFVRSTYSGAAYSNPCYATYYYYQYNYAWNGWCNPGWDGKVNNGWQIASKVSSIKPTPDTFPPEFNHGGLMDTYVDTSRSLTFTISDVGDPAMGLNTSSGTDANGVLEGPHMQYRTLDADAGTWSAWTTRSFSPVGQTRANCEMNECTWTASIPGTDRGNTVEYTMHAKDLNGNWNNTTAFSYDIATPTKIFVLEWNEMNAGFSQGYTVSYQVRLYDVTNEIEFTYDTSSNPYYDYEYIGFQNPAGTSGEMLRSRGPGYVAGVNQFTNNYRIATDGADYGVETYAAGMSPLFNYDEEMVGSGNGYPYTYYCTRYFTQNRGDCSTVVDLPEGFEFDYFGSTFNGTQGHKIHAIRHGAMQFSQSSTTNSAQMMYYGWGTTMPSLPSTASYVNNIDLAPYWGYYGAYYCFYNSAIECSIRSKMIPFDGAGMDVTQDITDPTIWDAEQSPIRVNPANGDYLQVSADLTIEAGVEVQIAEGKGIVFTGACNSLTVNGNATHPVMIKNMGTNYAKGLAFTNGCVDTEDRHTFTHTNFENLSIAISAGSRHGASPHYNGNVGNFTFSDVTFNNVDTAISHGSGQGTGFDLSGVSVSNSADSCVDLPDDSSLTWIGGSATDCNTHGYAGQGAVNTGSGSTVVMENVDITDAGVNGIFGAADSLWMSNITVDASGFSGQQSGTAVAQTGSSSSGTSIYAFNVDMNNYVAAMTTHATDSLHLEDLDSTGDSNGYYIAPAGASSPAIGDTGWTMDGMVADGGLTMSRTQPSNMDNIDLGGALSLSGSAPSTDRMSGSTVSAAGMTINGCGWNIAMDGVSLGDGSSDTWVSANCASTSSSNVVTISDGTMSGDSTNNNFAYARNSVLTIADMVVTGQTNWGNNLASAGTNGDIRLIDVNFQGNDCLDSNNQADTSVCWVEAASSSAAVYFGGSATVSVYRSGNSGDAFQANHAVTTALVDGSGTEIFNVGTGKTDSGGAATVWLITDLYEMDNNGNTAHSTSYTDHSIYASGGAGQNVTTPTDPWYTAGFATNIGAGYAGDLPLEVGASIYLKLEAFPMDFGGATKDCTFFSNNDSASNVGGYYTYTRQIITLSSDMVLDGCSVHLQGTSLRINRTASSNPTITLRNGAELLISEHDGDYGHIKAQQSTYPWNMDIDNGGQLTIDAGSIRDMNGGLSVGDGGTLEMRNGSTAYGSPNAAASTATVDVDGGTLIINNAVVQNVNSGVGIHLENTAGSSLSNVLVKNAATGIEVHNAAPSIDGFTLTDNTVGMDVEGGMSLPTIYRSTILSGESAGWKTHAIDITSFAKENNYVQVGVNQVYGGGNSDPYFGSYYAKYFLTTDRYRIATKTTGGSLTNVTDASVEGYYPWSTSDATANGLTYSGGVGGAPVWDCNLYGYEYNPGGSYRYGYYYYLINYGGYTQGPNGYYGRDAYPSDFGFRYEAADDLTANTNYYPYHFWGSYWPSFYYAGQWAPPEGFNGLWGNYNVCQDYAYSAVTPNPAGARVAFPIVDTSAADLEQVVMYIDMVHYGADYYADRLDLTVRTGNSVSSLLAADYAREFGTAQIDNGVITGADTGIQIGGARAAADIGTVTVTSPTDQGLLIDGSTSATVDSLQVDGGRYGVRMTNAAGGKLGLTNMALDSQTNDGLVLSKALNMDASGSITNAGYCGIKVLASSTHDWEFDAMTIDNNGVGVNHAGSGNVFISNTDFNGNTDDVKLSNGATMDFLEGTVDANTVTADDASKFTRLRSLDVDISADGSGVASAPVKILDGDNKVIDSGTTDATGEVNDLTFVTWTVDSSGQSTANLAGYQLVTIAKIAYNSGSTIDIRYAMNGITVADTSGNTASATLTQSIDSRICYGSASASYNVMGACTGLNYRDDRTVDGVDEYGYYVGDQGSSTEYDMTNQVIQMDSPYNYFDIGSKGVSFNNSVIFTTGTYNQMTTMYPVYPYDGHLYMDNVTIIAMGDESTSGPSSFRIGYSGTYAYGQIHITNSDLLGLNAIATGSGYYLNNGDLEVTDNMIVHYRSSEKSTSIFYDDMCIQSSGYDDVVIENNVMVDCGVGVFVPNNFYATSSTYNGNGTNNMQVNGNTFVDCVNLCMWYYLNADATNAQFNGNTIEGMSPRYAVYNQDGTVHDIEIDGNTLHADNPIYLRGTREWTITNNDITGIKSASNACIYALNGFGTIEGNSCTDADGGIALSGVRSGQEVHINANTIDFSYGRLPTSAVGIYVNGCGLDEVFMANNVISTVMNGLNTNGCDVTDNGSSYTAMGGRAARIHNVDMQQSTFSPSHLTGVCIGDSVRWTSRAYGSSNTPHTTTSDAGQAESWDSGTMNLGSSFVHQFNNAGNFSYYSSSATTVTGTVEVTACTSNLQTTGIDIMGGGDDITLNGVTVTGYGLGLTQDGGDLTLAGNSLITGDAIAVELTDVDVVTAGAILQANDTYGIALDVSSAGGNDVLDMTGLSVSGSIGVLADGHEMMRWNGGVADADTVLKVVNGASGTIENMTGSFEVAPGVIMPVPWSSTAGCANAVTCGGPTTQINAGAYSTITSIGNGVLNNGAIGAGPTKLVIDSDAIVHEGNLLDLTVTHNGGPASDVGLYIRSIAQATNLATGELVNVPGGRAEYVSPSWRASAGRSITIDGIYYDWYGSNLLNSADDMMPGAVAVNATTQANMHVTWDANFMYVALIGPTFSLTDGMAYLDTGAGGSNQGDNWHVTHTLPFEADYMLWMEDLNNWGIRKVMPTGNWVDTTSSCTSLDAYLFMGNPYLSTPVSEFRIPWDCVGSPTHNVRWIALTQWDGVPGFGSAGQVAGVFPEQSYDPSTTSGQTFTEMGNFNLVGGDLADGTLDDHLLIFRTYTGSNTPGNAHIYQIMVKTNNAEGDYYDWGDYAPLIMTTNQDVTIDILRAKPVIENLVDVEYDEDSGSHTITLNDKASDHQDTSDSLSWFVTDYPGNTHTYATPYSYTLNGNAGTAGGLNDASLSIDTLQDQFGGHRLVLTVIDSHGMTAMQTMNVGIWNVNDPPIICNTARFDCMPVFYDDGAGNLNVHDENFNGLITKGLGDTSNASLSYVVDMANEQTQSDWNNEAIPQTYTWMADEGLDCTPFSTTVTMNVIEIAENTANEAGGNCDIVMSLSDGANMNSEAADVTVNFIVNPVNDAPVIETFDAVAGDYVETSNGSLQLDWFWDVMEDDEDATNLTFDLSRLMADNDHPLEQLSWSVEETQLCPYENYFSITVDNAADTLELDLIDDAATDAPTSEIDFLQDADGDGVADGGVHQIQPPSGVYCTVYLWLNDTATAPSHIDYAQSPSGVYEQRTVRETIYIRVINTPEARADYQFTDGGDFNWLNIEAVLPGTRVPVDIDITNLGDDPAEYNYAHDVQVRFYVDDNPTLMQDQITLSWDNGDVPGIGESKTIRGHVTVNNPSEYVRAFIEVRTINPHTGDYIDSSIRRSALEELNWGNNNVTTDDTGNGLPSMVMLRPALSVSSFAPGLVAVSLVGAFVGALLMRSRQDDDEAEFTALSDDDEAVSPVIATILLVAITVVLSGVIYVWAQSLAQDSTGKATPRMTFDEEARFQHTSDESLWYWRIAVLDGEELAAQAVFVKVEWMDGEGEMQSYTTSLANPDGVYGRIPSNSPDALVTYKDSINCAQDCSAGFGASDFIQVRMTDPANDDERIDSATITLQYAPAGGSAYILMTYGATFNPPAISPVY